MLDRADGSTLDEIIAEAGCQKHTIRGFISTRASKHRLVVTSTHRDANKGRVRAIAHQAGFSWD